MKVYMAMAYESGDRDSCSEKVCSLETLLSVKNNVLIELHYMVFTISLLQASHGFNAFHHKLFNLDNVPLK